MLKKTDYIVLGIICFFLGIFVVSQFFSTKTVKKLSQPENNEILALEVAKLTKANADLRSEVNDLTHNLDTYRDSTASRKSAYDQYLNDLDRFDNINGSKAVSGQGILIRVDGSLITPQVVDLVNAIKNIGAEVIEINGTRLMLNTDLSQFTGFTNYDIKVLGNSKLLKSAMERKGGIIEQIASKDIRFSIDEMENLTIAAGKQLTLKQSKIVEN